jgi:hypothetical protein
MLRVLKYLFLVAICAALGLMAYAMLADLPPPKRAVEVELPMPAPAPAGQ